MSMRSMKMLWFHLQICRFSSFFCFGVFHGFRFNHETGREHVHVESDDVCPVCGELEGCCDHTESESMDSLLSNSSDIQESIRTSSADGEDDDFLTNTEEDSNGGRLMLDIRMIRSCKSGDELFNTYGMLSNADLLRKHGFCHPDNACDHVTLSKEALYQASKTLELDDTVKRELLLPVNMNHKGKIDKKQLLRLEWAFKTGLKRKRTDSTDAVKHVLNKAIDQRLALYNDVDHRESAFLITTECNILGKCKQFINP